MTWPASTPPTRHRSTSACGRGSAGLRHEDVERALYDHRSVLKVLGMRRTMFVMPVGLAGIVQAAVTTTLAAAERKRLLGMLRDAGIADDPARWLAEVEAETVAVLDELGEATAADLTKRVPGLREQISFGEGRKWAGKVGVSTRLLFLLATEARIVRGRPKGSWLSSLYRWAPMDRWVEGGLEPWPAERARVELARRWLRTFGPGTLRDLQWWAGWTVAATRQALAGCGAVEVSLADGASGGPAATGWVLEDDLDDDARSGAWVALLPALDTTTMGWTERGFYLGEHGPALFDRNGNAGPTIWVDGRVVGGWAQRASGEIVHRLLEDVGTEVRREIQGEAARLAEWLGAARIIPRFRTPTGADARRLTACNRSPSGERSSTYHHHGDRSRNPISPHARRRLHRVAGSGGRAGRRRDDVPPE